MSSPATTCCPARTSRSTTDRAAMPLAKANDLAAPCSDAPELRPQLSFSEVHPIHCEHSSGVRRQRGPPKVSHCAITSSPVQQS